MRVLLLIAVIVLGADALFYNGSYTQAAYREAAALVQRLASKVSTSERTGPAERDQPAGDLPRERPPARLP